jgi:oligoribonuclease NrnB/cAMP/cGMP phosphodiesterase (DHH superfamily)
MKLYYHNDLDGRCAAAIALRAKGFPIDLFEDDGAVELDYKDFDTLFDLNKVESQEEVIIVDFSFPHEAFGDLLAKTDLVVWIDHHKTAIEELSDYEGVPGIRESGKDSAALLAWRYFFPDLEPTEAVILTSKYDTWNFEPGSRPILFYYGMKAEKSHNPVDAIWIALLDPDSPEECEEVPALDRVLQNGKPIMAAEEAQNREYVTHYAYPTTFCGYRSIVCNKGLTNSKLFDALPEDEFDLMVVYAFDGKAWRVSLYTKNESIDVSEIAKKYGGGGHKQAAGFVCETEFMTTHLHLL